MNSAIAQQLQTAGVAHICRDCNGSRVIRVKRIDMVDTRNPAAGFSESEYETLPCPKCSCGGVAFQNSGALVLK